LKRKLSVSIGLMSIQAFNEKESARSCFERRKIEEEKEDFASYSHIHR